MKKPRIMLATVMPLIGSSNHAPMPPVDFVDIVRFMCDWYVIAHSPTWQAVGAHTAVETDDKSDDGTIATTFTFRDGGFDGDLKKYNPTGYIEDSKTNALWGMQFIWPIKADYRIVYLDDDYTKTVIGREARDYVWLMARNPELTDEEYEEIVEYIESIGYDISKLKRVPQQWPQAGMNQAGNEETL
mgnify:CR=1 FL=1